MRDGLCLAICGFAVLAGCGQSTESGRKAAVAGKGEPSAADLCVSSSCGEAIFLVNIPDAENILFGPGGRLFVSGGQNVYEVTRSADGSYTARPLAAQPCNFTGLAIHRNHLYATCGEGPLYAGKLAGDFALVPVYRFEGMCIPNGTALGPDNRLYVVDEPLNCLQPDPKIVALTLDAADPLKVVAQEAWVQGSPTGLLWIGQDNVLRFPNGLVRDGNTFYGTDGGSVYAVSVGDDGTAGEVTPLFFEETAHDDLALGGSDGLLVTDFFKGRIFLLSRSGELLQETDPGTFSEPSAVRLGQPPLFERTDILVTDKGVIGEESLPQDGLYLFRRKAI